MIQISQIQFENEEFEAVRHVLASGQLREGPKTAEFEKMFAVRTGAEHAIAASSGTAALHLAYMAALNPGDEVLVPAFTFFATASMVLAAGCVPVFCDVDPKTWVLTAQEVEKRLSPKTRAIAGVHLFGNVCEIEQIERLAKKHSLKLIWDAAQSMGSCYGRRDVGAFADAVCFSFYPTKNMTTGEGGMVTVKDDALAAKIRLLKAHGQTGRYIHEMVGYNYRMTDVEAALGLVQLNKLERFLNRRRQIAAQYTHFFSSQKGFSIQEVTENAEHSWNYFSVVPDPDYLRLSREEFIRSLNLEGVPTAIHYPRPLHLQPCFSEYQTGSLPVAEKLADQIVALPIHPFLSEADVSFILEKIQKVTQRHLVS